MRIDASGRWFYNGTVVQRERMVALFSTILRLDGDQYCLVTPQEKLLIEVEDVPFIASLMEVSEAGNALQQLHFTLNTGHQLVANASHPLCISFHTAESRPYLRVRDRLSALLSRPVFYQLVELLVNREGRDGVYSDGAFFDMAERSELPWLQDS